MLTRTLTVALVGNPNTGKTTLFNALSGLRQRVGNYPGVTVELKKGHASVAGLGIDLIDLPGTYSLAARSPDEMVAVDLLLGRRPEEPRPDAVVAIVDASNLQRHLYLTTQVLDLGVPVVVALNMIDVAAARGIRIDAERLAKQLGVPVVPIQANKGRGLDRLKQAVADAAGGPPPPRMPRFPEAFDREVDGLIEALGDDTPRPLARRILLDVGGDAERRAVAAHGEPLRTHLHAARQRLAEAGCGVPAVEARTRYAWVREVTAGCVEQPKDRRVSGSDRIDHVLTHKIWGTLIFLAVMFVVFQAIFTAAEPLMEGIAAGKDALAEWLRDLLPAGPLTSLLLDGVLEGVGSVIVFVPQILILFGFIAVLEDCGYMARAAFLMDRLMARCGLSGKSFIPLLSSVACAVPGIMATRVIEDRRDRLATILVAPLMSCSARLPLYILLIGAFLSEPWWLKGLVMFALYALGMVVAPLVALALKRTLLRGQTPLFVLEMPAYKWPAWRSVLRRMFDAGAAFVRRAGTLILASMVLVWALLYFPHRDARGEAYEERIAAYQEDAEKAAKAAEAADDPAEKGKQEAAADEAKREGDRLNGEWKRQSLLGRAGLALEPAFRPLGWDWRIGMAALASFPAREVVVGTLGLIYNEGKVESKDIRQAKDAGKTRLGQAVQREWNADRPGLQTPRALSLLVFFALCCQCASTLAVIRRETKSWAWPAFTFAYMTVLAYVGALVVFQVGAWLVG